MKLTDSKKVWDLLVIVSIKAAYNIYSDFKQSDFYNSMYLIYRQHTANR